MWPSRSEPRTAYKSGEADPKALGTLTRLACGKLTAAFVESPGVVRMLTSEDGGATWTATGAVDCSPLEQACPSGRLVEIKDELLMPLFGNLPAGGKQVSCSGLLRSADGGKTWGPFTEIACDRDEGKVEFGPTAVHADPSGKMLALISAGDTYLYRSLSSDGGRTWSSPEQRLLACKPALAAVGPTLACVDQDSQTRGVMRVQFSDDLFDGWRCDRMLDQDLKGEHASAVGLDEDRLLLVHDRGGFKPEGRGTPATKGIEVALMQRNPAAPAILPFSFIRWVIITRSMTGIFRAAIGVLKAL